jgi:hypothetical protein
MVAVRFEEPLNPKLKLGENEKSISNVKPLMSPYIRPTPFGVGC